MTKNSFLVTWSSTEVTYFKELHREIREKSRYPVPNSEVVKNFEQNRLGTFCYPPWVVLCAKYELLTPSGVRELTEVASHAKFALFGSRVEIFLEYHIF